MSQQLKVCTQKTRVQFPELTLGDSQLPITQFQGDLMPLVSVNTYIYMHILTHTYTQFFNWFLEPTTPLCDELQRG